MAIFSRLIFSAVSWSARRGLRDDGDLPIDESTRGARQEKHQQKEKPRGARQEKHQQKEKARRTGVRGETYGYWYLRRHGYVFVAKNYMPHGAKGELDLVGYDGETLAFVEVRTRTAAGNLPALPELSVTRSKQSVLIRTAQRFLADRHLRECPTRFDLLAIDNIPGRHPEVRLHKDAFSPQLKR